MHCPRVAVWTVVLALSVGRLASAAPATQYHLRFSARHDKEIARVAKNEGLPRDTLRLARKLGIRHCIRQGNPVAGRLLFGLTGRTAAERKLTQATVVRGETGRAVVATAVRLGDGEALPVPAVLNGEWNIGQAAAEFRRSSPTGLGVYLSHPDLEFGGPGIPEGLYRIRFRVRVRLTYGDKATETMVCTSEPWTFAVVPRADEFTYLNTWGRHVWACMHDKLRLHAEVLAMAREWTRAVEQSNAKPDFGFVCAVYQRLAPVDEAYRFFSRAYADAPQQFGSRHLRWAFREVCRKAGHPCPLDPPLAYPREVEDRILQAWRESSTEKAGKLFGASFGKSRPITPEELAQRPQVVQDAYAIFRELYTPFSLKRLGKDLREPDRNVRFVIVQDSLDVIVQRGGQPAQCLTITGFRPRLKPMPAKPLLGARSCQELVHNWLDSSYAFGKHGAGTALAGNELRARQDKALPRARFLSRVLLWGGPTMGGDQRSFAGPEVLKLVFRADGRRATAFFFVNCWFGEADFSLAEGTWHMTQARLTSIE